LPANASDRGEPSLTGPLTGAPEVDADLARVVAAWPALPAALKAAVLAVIRAAE
jgi:hypothetical protein